MGDHYYSDQPQIKSQPKKIKETLLGQKLTFVTDNGVFSKDKVDFGSRLLLETVAADLPSGGHLLDLGCGYGPIGIPLAKVDSSCTVDMVDVNERALDWCKANAELNEVTNVKVYKSSVFEAIGVNDFKAIISNPPIRAGKKTVHQILEEAYDYLHTSGKLYIVIQKKQGAPSAKKKMEEVFGNVERIGLDKGYWILVSQKKDDRDD